MQTFVRILWCVFPLFHSPTITAPSDPNYRHTPFKRFLRLRLENTVFIRTGFRPKRSVVVTPGIYSFKRLLSCIR